MKLDSCESKGSNGAPRYWVAITDEAGNVTEIDMVSHNQADELAYRLRFALDVTYTEKVPSFSI